MCVCIYIYIYNTYIYIYVYIYIHIYICTDTQRQVVTNKYNKSVILCSPECHSHSANTGKYTFRHENRLSNMDTIILVRDHPDI